MSDMSASPVLRVLEALLDATLCEDCLVQITGLGVGDVASALHRLTTLFTVVETHDVCEVCRKRTAVYQMEKPARS